MFRKHGPGVSDISTGSSELGRGRSSGAETDAYTQALWEKGPNSTTQPQTAPTAHSEALMPAESNFPKYLPEGSGHRLHSVNLDVIPELKTQIARKSR